MRFFGRAHNWMRGLGFQTIEDAFEKLSNFLDNEETQNNLAPEPFRSAVKAGLACDHVPGARGDFGRSASNPIPVNGPIGEVLYLSRLVTAGGHALFFHRLGSAGTLDVYETVSADEKVWDVLIMDCYHPRKSRSVPGGYRFAVGEERSPLFSGTNVFVQNFPQDLPDAIADTWRRFVGIEFAGPQVRANLERKQFVRPYEHAEIVNAIRRQLQSSANS